MPRINNLVLIVSVVLLAFAMAGALSYFDLHNEAMLSARLTPNEIDEISERLFAIAVLIFLLVSLLAAIVGLVLSRFVDAKSLNPRDASNRCVTKLGRASESDYKDANVAAADSRRSGTPLKSSSGRARRDPRALSATLGREILSPLNDLRLVLDVLKGKHTRLDETLEADQIVLTNERASLFDVLEQVKIAFDDRVKAKALEFAIYYEYPLPDFIWIDASRLKQVLGHLVGNAIEFTQDGEVHIRVRYHTTLQRVIFEVTDTGIGLTSDQQETVFRAYSKKRVSLTEPFSQCHLRLYFSRVIAKRLGGDLSVRSLPGQGSCFSFSVSCADTMPLKLISARPESVSLINSTNDRLNSKMLSDDLLSLSSETSPPRRQHPTHTK